MPNHARTLPRSNSTMKKSVRRDSQMTKTNATNSIDGMEDCLHSSILNQMWLFCFIRVLFCLTHVLYCQIGLFFVSSISYFVSSKFYFETIIRIRYETPKSVKKCVNCDGSTLRLSLQFRIRLLGRLDKLTWIFELASLSCNIGLAVFPIQLST